MAGHRLRSVLPSSGSSASCSSGVRSSRNTTAVATSAMGLTGAGYTVAGRAGRMRHPSSCECEACSRKARRFSLVDTLAARGVPGASRERGMPVRAFPELTSLVGSGSRAPSDDYPEPKRPPKPPRLPFGQARYEVMVVLRPDLSEDEWEEELARFESSLDKAGVTEIDSLVRGRQRMAYPINGCVYGLFVLYTFIGDHSVGRAVQKFFNAPDLRPQKPILRHMCQRTQ